LPQKKKQLDKPVDLLVSPLIPTSGIPLTSPKPGFYTTCLKEDLSQQNTAVMD